VAKRRFEGEIYVIHVGKRNYMMVLLYGEEMGNVIVIMIVKAK
jgi:hypothetical protein